MKLRSIATWDQDLIISLLRPTLVKKQVVYKVIPDSEKWRVAMCKELLSVQNGEMKIPGFSSDEESELLRHLCIS